MSKNTKTVAELDTIKRQAENACKYVLDGEWFQMNGTDEDGIYFENQDTGDTHQENWEDVSGQFWELKPMGSQPIANTDMSVSTDLLDEYAYINFSRNGKSAGSITVKLDTEGVIVDAFDIGRTCLSTMAIFYDDFDAGKEEQE